MSLLEELNRLSLPPAGHWHKKAAQVPRYKFGQGAVKEFSWFFEGKCKVKVKTVRDICKWLVKCKYMSDMDIFMEEDFWQHPVTFEHLKKGDCEDHALWAWRRLTEIKVKAEFVSGQWLERVNGELVEQGHAWINFEDPKDRRWYVLESTEKSLKHMVVSFDDAEKLYFPRFSIDGELNTYRYSIAAKNRKA